MAHEHPLSRLAIICLVAASSLQPAIAQQPPAPLRLAPSPLLAVDQSRASIVEGIVGQWRDALVAAYGSAAAEREATLRAGLMQLRADRLLAASLAGTVEGLERMIREESAAPPPAALQATSSTKALGDANADLVYTPVTPCRILDTRSGGGGTLLATTTRNLLAANPGGTFSAQGGAASNCAIPVKPAAVMMNLTVAQNAAGPAFLVAWPFNQTRPGASTLNWNSVGQQIANAVAVPLCQGGGCTADFSLYASADTEVIVDVVGYFSAPGGTVGDITAVSVTPGGGLSGGGTSGAVSISLAHGDYVDLANVQTLTGVKTFNPSSGSVPFAVDASKSATVANLRAQYADSAATASALSSAALAQYGLPGGLPARTNTITAVDTAGTVGYYTSITLGADGLPVISYQDATNADLKVAKCANSACTSATITAIDTAGIVGTYTSITLGADGLPVISYHDQTNLDLKVAKCANAACTGSATITTVDTVGLVGEYTSIALGAEGLPVISYYDVTNGDLKVAKCANAACTGSATITVLDTVGLVGVYTSITLGADALPVISYYDVTNGDLKVAKCANAACTGSATITAIDTAGHVGWYTSIALGADGLPMISYYDWTNGDLKVAKCANAACTGSATITAVDTAGDVGWYTSITLGADGLPVISYYDATNGDLKVAKCANAACTGTATITAIDTAGDVGWHTSITLGADGWPVISYFDDISRGFKVAKCANAFCVNYLGRR